MTEYNNDMDVSDCDEAYASASDGGNPPYGLYDTEILEVGCKYTSKGDRLLMVMREVIAGDYEGHKLWTNYKIAPNMQWKIKKDVSAMGLQQYKNMTELIRYMDEWAGLQHRVRLYEREHEGKTYPEFEILKVLRGPDKPQGADEPPPPRDSDLPF